MNLNKKQMWDIQFSNSIMKEKEKDYFNYGMI